jgi:hypothetical protein
MRRSPLLLGGLLLAALACASGGGGGAATTAAPADSTGAAAATTPRPSGNRNLLTAQELNSVGSQNLRDVVNALRPRWLQNTSAGSLSGPNGGVTVYMSGQLLGGLDALATVQKGSVDRMVYYSITEAQARYGMRVRTPVIEIRLKSGG